LNNKPIQVKFVPARTYSKGIMTDLVNLVYDWIEANYHSTCSCSTILRK